MNTAFSPEEKTADFGVVIPPIQNERPVDVAYLKRVSPVVLLHPTRLLTLVVGVAKCRVLCLVRIDMRSGTLVFPDSGEEKMYFFCYCVANVGREILMTPFSPVYPDPASRNVPPAQNGPARCTPTN